jgi:voltage-gated potassium channel
MSSLEARLQRVFDTATLVAALATVPVVVTIALDPPGATRAALIAVNWGLWGVFALELATMLAISRDRGAWLRENIATPGIVMLTPPPFAGLALFRLVRLMRGRAARRAADAVTTQEGLRNLALLTALTVGLGGILFAEVEPGVGVGDGVYWAVTTVTTVGYGDIAPTTSAGKVLAIYVMLIGVAFVAILTGSLAQRFVSRWRDVPADAAAAAGGHDAVLAKLDELGERLAAVERAVVTRPRD